MAFDTSCNRVVLFGGGPTLTNTLGDTWEWDGNTWVNKADGPVAQWSNIAFDSYRNVTVLFGGQLTDVTWEYDGTTWTQKFPSNNQQQDSCTL
jgi:hypothetical protein